MLVKGTLAGSLRDKEMNMNLESADHLWRQALDYMSTEGWKTLEVDDAIADRIYARWIRETNDIWLLSGFRDRTPLHEALEETFTQHYGDTGGKARLLIHALLLELRARRAGLAPPGRHEI